MLYSGTVGTNSDCAAAGRNGRNNLSDPLVAHKLGAGQFVSQQPQAGVQRIDMRVCTMDVALDGSGLISVTAASFGRLHEPNLCNIVSAVAVV